MIALFTAWFRRLHTAQCAVLASAALMLMVALATISTAYAQGSEVDVGLSTADIRVEGCEVIYETQCVITPIAWDEEKGVDGRAIASIFSYTVCNVEQILGEVFGKMWCAVSEAAMGPVAAVLVLYVAITGLMLTLGMIELTGAEIAKHVVKIGLVWVFVTNPDYALGIVYRFYMFVLKDGIDIVFTGTNPAGVNSTTDVMHHLDIAAEKIFGGPEDEGITFMAAVSALLFTPGGNITGPMLAAEALFSFFVFARTVMAYLISIAGMVFLLTLGPIFIPMALFSKTSDIFERWVKHITSFALQPIIIFAYLIMMEGYIGGVKEMLEVDEFITGQFTDDCKPIDQSLGPLTFAMQQYCVCYEASCGGSPEDPTVVSYDYAYNDANSISPGLEPTIIGMVALLILDFVTLAFLDKVPELARAITNAPRVLKVGGGYTMASQGGALDMPGAGLYDSIKQGALSGYNNAQSTADRPASVGQGAMMGLRNYFAGSTNQAGQRTPGAVEQAVLGLGKDPNQ